MSKNLLDISKKWGNYKTVAVWYIWRIIDPEVVQYWLIFIMKKPIEDKKLKKKIKKQKKDKVILDEYGDILRKNINYDKDKPPHW